MVLEGDSEIKLPEEVIKRALGQAEQAEGRRAPYLSGRISILLTRIYAAAMAVIIFACFLALAGTSANRGRSQWLFLRRLTRRPVIIQLYP